MEKFTRTNGTGSNNIASAGRMRVNSIIQREEMKLVSIIVMYNY